MWYIPGVVYARCIICRNMVSLFFLSIFWRFLDCLHFLLQWVCCSKSDYICRNLFLFHKQLCLVFVSANYYFVSYRRFLFWIPLWWTIQFWHSLLLGITAVRRTVADFLVQVWPLFFHAVLGPPPSFMQVSYGYEDL